MQIEVSESTVQQIAQRVKDQGLTEVSGPDLVVRILNALACSTNVLTNAAIAQHLRDTPAETESETARDVPERLGLVGAFESGVTDLSTNPVHMVGWGNDSRRACGYRAAGRDSRSIR